MPKPTPTPFARLLMKYCRHTETFYIIDQNPIDLEICDEGLRNQFELPSGLKLLDLCLSHEPHPEAVRVMIHHYQSPQGEECWDLSLKDRAIFDHLNRDQYAILRALGLRVSKPLYAWIEY